VHGDHGDHDGKLFHTPMMKYGPVQRKQFEKKTRNKKRREGKKPL
jgi:hypothetical protein